MRYRKENDIHSDAIADAVNGYRMEVIGGIAGAGIAMAYQSGLGST